MSNLLSQALGANVSELVGIKRRQACIVLLHFKSFRYQGPFRMFSNCHSFSVRDFIAHIIPNIYGSTNPKAFLKLADSKTNETITRYNNDQARFPPKQSE